MQIMRNEGEIPSENERHLVLEDIRRDAYTKLLQQVSKSSMTIWIISIGLTAHYGFKGQGFFHCCEWSARTDELETGETKPQIDHPSFKVFCIIGRLAYSL